MREMAELAIDFIYGRERADFDRDPMLLLAVTRAVEIIGEAASRISSQMRAQHPTVPWSAILGMRNRLVHAYFDINRDVLWKTVTIELPELLASLRKIDS